MSLTYHKTKHMQSSTVRCDWKPATLDYEGLGYCDEKMVSFSDVAVVEKQAQHKGWTIKEARRDERNQGVHLCPKHQGASRYMMPQTRE